MRLDVVRAGVEPSLQQQARSFRVACYGVQLAVLCVVGLGFMSLSGG